jgi:small-conductance mechanosensitive channel
MKKLLLFCLTISTFCATGQSTSALQLSDSVTADLISRIEKKQNLKELEAERIVRKKNLIDSLRFTASGAPVIPFFDDTLFVFFANSGSYSPAERAEATNKRIKTLANNFRFKTESLKIIPNESTLDITFGETTLVSVSEDDAIWANTTRANLANQFKEKITAAIIKYRASINWENITKKIALGILVFSTLVLMILLIVQFFRFTQRKIESQKGRFLKGVKFNDYSLIDSSRQIEVFTSINNLIKWIVIIASVNIALPVLLSIFPWTEGIADILFGYILTPLRNILISFWEYLPNLFTLLVIYFVFKYILKILNFSKEEIEKEHLVIPGFHTDWANPTYQIIRVLIYAFMLVVSFPYLPGSHSPVFQGVSIFLGILFTFGSTSSLSNVISGLVLTYMRPFILGDRVKIGDVVGEVIEKTLLVTRIKTSSNEIISIPNSNVINIPTTNFSSELHLQGAGVILHSIVTISYTERWTEVQEALIEAALKTPFTLLSPKPFVLQTALGDYGVAYQINVYTKQPDKERLIMSHLHQNIQEVFTEKNIKIMLPHLIV